MLLSRGLLIPAYFLSAVMGVFGLLYPAPSVASIIGNLFALLYALLIFVGACGSLFGVIAKKYRVEMVFLWFLAGGFLCYSIGLWGLYMERIVNPAESAAPYGPALVTAILSMFLFAKAFTLFRLNRRLINASYDG